jgi:hypothetical protein
LSTPPFSRYDLRQLYLERGNLSAMDKISEALLSEFSDQFAISHLREDDRFEQFTAWLTVRRHYSDTTFDPGELVTQHATGIDAIAIVVNNELVTDLDDVENILAVNSYMNVEFIFVEAERSPHFDIQKIGNLGYAVSDFIGARRNPATEWTAGAAEIFDAIYKQSSKFRPNIPRCVLYYVTTGPRQRDSSLSARAETVVEDLKRTGLFYAVDFDIYGADEIHKLYQQSKNSVTRTFEFSQKAAAPPVVGVREAYLGYLQATVFLKIVCDEEEKIIKSLFYDNIRDWLGYGEINAEIRETLRNTTRDRFILMNNGVTLIAKSLQPVANTFTISDFQVVNGCQTSHVLYDNRALLTESVYLPFRIVCTLDEDVRNDIIKATNRQTPVKTEQFFAMTDFAKKLEQYFRSFSLERRLYYERRPHQYDSDEIDKRRIIPHHNLVRAVGAIFLGEPHITTKNYRALSTKVGKEIFLETDKLEIYYAAASALYKLDLLFVTGRIPSRYKAARYQILLAARCMIASHPLPFRNSQEMAKRCDRIIESLWNDQKCEELFAAAVSVIDKVAGADWDRDSIRTERMNKGITDEVTLHIGKVCEI